ncbi:hypothetical protein LEMLEM_LOCUS16514 [Lemmus lemmus]
MDSTTCD